VRKRKPSTRRQARTTNQRPTSQLATLPTTTVPIVTRIREQLPPVGVTDRQSALLTAVFTKDVDGHALLSDRRQAIANLILKDRIAQVLQSRRLQRELGAVRRRRRQQNPDGLYLITEVSRFIREPRRQPALGAVTARDFDLVVEGPLIRIAGPGGQRGDDSPIPA
jgi:hypothetical protein